MRFAITVVVAVLVACASFQLVPAASARADGGPLPEPLATPLEGTPGVGDAALSPLASEPGSAAGVQEQEARSVSGTLLDVAEPLLPAPIVDAVAPILAPVNEVIAPVLEMAAPVLEPLKPAIDEAVAPVMPALASILEPVAPVLDSQPPIVENSHPGILGLPSLPLAEPVLPASGLPTVTAFSPDASPDGRAPSLVGSSPAEVATLGPQLRPRSTETRGAVTTGATVRPVIAPPVSPGPEAAAPPAATSGRVPLPEFPGASACVAALALLAALVLTRGARLFEVGPPLSAACLPAVPPG